MIESTPRLPNATDDAFLRELVRVLERVLSANGTTLARLAEGRVSAAVSAASGPPTGGQWAQGDVVRNSAPVEAGSGGSQYVVVGWVCVAGGTPGTWLPMRTLTGN